MPETSPTAIDCYQCIVEPAELWAERLPSRFKEMAPRVVEAPDGGQAWAFEGGATLLPLSNLILAERAPERPTLLTDSYETMRPGCYHAGERIKDLDIDGIAMGIVFPQVGQHLHHLQDAELYKACVQAYNDGILEWCRAGDPKRLFPVGIVPLLSVDEAVAELRRITSQGYKAVLFNGWPNATGDINSADDAFWRACEETQAVVCFNKGPVVRSPAKAPAGVGGREAATVLAKTLVEVTVDSMGSGFGTAQAVGRLALRGILERFPRLKVCFSGTGAGWLPYFLEQVDGMYFHDRFHATFPSRMLPSEYIKRNSKLTFHLDTMAIENRDEIGVENLMWASHYPLESCDWPDSGHIIEQQLGGIPDDERRLMTADNAAAYFGT